MKILFAASEAVPFAASGGLADVAGSLPKAIASKGHECCVVIPKYSDIPEELLEDAYFVANLTVDVSWRKQYCGIYKTEKDGIAYYFIENDYYFERDGLSDSMTTAKDSFSLTGLCLKCSAILTSNLTS